MTSERKIREPRRLVSLILALAAMVLLTTSFFVRNAETTKLLRLISFALLLGNIIYLLFQGSFGYKPTREEMEEKLFGKNK